MAVISQKCLKISAVNNYFQLRSILPREKLTFDGVNVLMLLLWSYKHRMTNDRHLHWEWHWITTTFYYKQPLNSCFRFNFFFLLQDSSCICFAEVSKLKKEKKFQFALHEFDVWRKLLPLLLLRALTIKNRALMCNIFALIML